MKTNCTLKRYSNFNLKLGVRATLAIEAWHFFAKVAGYTSEAAIGSCSAISVSSAQLLKRYLWVIVLLWSVLPDMPNILSNIKDVTH